MKIFKFIRLSYLEDWENNPEIQKSLEELKSLKPKVFIGDGATWQFPAIEKLLKPHLGELWTFSRLWGPEAKETLAFSGILSYDKNQRLFFLQDGNDRHVVLTIAASVFLSYQSMLVDAGKRHIDWASY